MSVEKMENNIVAACQDMFEKVLFGLFSYLGGVTVAKFTINTRFKCLNIMG